MKNVLITLAIIFLSGCAYTPEEIRKMNYSFVVLSDRAPYSAASCVARSFSDLGGEFHASVREGATPDSSEVILTMVGSTTLAVVDAIPQNKGSQLIFFFRSTSLDAEAAAKKFLNAGRKCQS